MMRKLGMACIKAKLAMRNVVEDFASDERGNIVEYIVLIVIVIAVAAIFRQQLEDVIKNAFKALNDFIG